MTIAYKKDNGVIRTVYVPDNEEIHYKLPQGIYVPEIDSRGGLYFDKKWSFTLFLSISWAIT